MEKTVNRYELNLLLIFFFAWGFVFLDRLAISYLLPVLSPVMHITNSQVGLIGFATTGAYALSAMFFSALSDKSGNRKKWLVLFLFVTAIASAICAFTTTFTQLVIARAFVGLGEGPLLPLMMAIMMSHSSENQFGRNAGIINMGVSIVAIIFGPVFITQLLKITTWQMTFLISAVPTFIFAILAMKFIRADESAAPSAENKQTQFFHNLIEMFKYKNVIVSAIISIICMSGYWALMLFAPLYWVNVGHVSVQKMGFITAGSGMIGLLYGVGIPKLSDNFGRKKILTIFAIGGAVAPLCMFFFLGSSLSMGAYLVFAAVPGCLTPLFFTLIPMESVPDSLKATASAFCIGCGEIIGGAISPAISGRIADIKGLPFMMLVSGSLMLLGFIMSLFITETNKKNQSKIVDSEQLAVVE